MVVLIMMMRIIMVVLYIKHEYIWIMINLFNFFHLLSLGLKPFQDKLDAVYATLNQSPYSIKMTKADFYQYAGMVAIWCSLPDASITGSTTVMDLPFRWGRRDAADCKNKAHRLPGAETGITSVKNWATLLGLSLQEMVTLMGAHALGTTKLSNSGYTAPQDGVTIDGKWVGRNAELSGQGFYRAVIAIPWGRQVNAAATKHSFINTGGGGATIMLNTDMALFWELGDAVNPNGCRSRPPSGNLGALVNAGGCPFALGETVSDHGATIKTTTDLAFAYSDATTGQALWVKDFIPAWQKFSELGTAASFLQVPCATCTTDPNYLVQIPSNDATVSPGTTVFPGTGTTNGGSNNDAATSGTGLSMNKITGIAGAVGGIILLGLFIWKIRGAKFLQSTKMESPKANKSPKSEGVAIPGKLKNPNNWAGNKV